MATAGLMLFTALSVHAVEPEVMVVTGQYQPRSLDDIAEPLVVISAEDIRSRAAPDLIALLDTLPGVYASAEGGSGGVNSLSIRGGEPNFTVVMMDGVALNDPTNTRGGSFDLSGASMSEAVRIEVLRGPQSLVYGADALAGVVNMISVPQSPRTGLRVAAEAGEFGVRRANAAAALAGDSQDFSLHASHRDAGSVQRGSALVFDAIAANYGLTLPKQWRLRMGGRRAVTEKAAYPEQSGGPSFSRSDAVDRSDGDDRSSYLNLGGELHPLWYTQFSATEFRRISEYDSPGVDPYTAVPPNRAESDYRRTDWRWHNRVGVAGLHADLGIDRRREVGDSRGQVDFSNLPPEAALFLLGLPGPSVDSGASIMLPSPLILDTDFELDRSTRGQYLQIRYDTVAEMRILAGWRRDRVADGADSLVRRYALHVPLHEALALWLSRSEGFKSPSFFALGHGLVGNPALRPELARSDELQLDWRQGGALRLGLALYRTRYDDLIDFDAEQFTNVNRDRVYSQGAELDFERHGEARWGLRGQVSYNDLEVVNSERRLANRPRWRATLTADYQISGALRMQLQARHTGRRQATSLHTGAVTQHTLSDYTLGSVALHWQPAPGWTTFLAIDNVLDADYDEAVGFPGAGRALRAGIRWEIIAQ